MSSTPSFTRLQSKGMLEHSSAEYGKEVGSRDPESGPDSDFDDPLPREGVNTGNQKSEKPAAEKPAAGKLVVIEEPEGNLIPDYQEIGERLKDVIRKHRKGLRKMYGETEDELDKNLKSPIKRGEEMAKRLITQMGCPRAIAKDLAVLTLYDVAILICMFQC